MIKQGNFINRKCNIFFNYNIKNFISGKIIRDDIEEPFKTLIKLNDGTIIDSKECLYQLI